MSIHWEEDGHHWQLTVPEESLVEVQVLHPVIVLQAGGGLGEGGLGLGGVGGGEGEELQAPPLEVS